MSKRTTFITISILITLSWLTYFRIFDFGFWKDDWINWWGAYFKSPLFLAYWFHPGTTLEFLLFSPFLPANSIGWQIIGFGFKVFAVISCMFFVKALCKSNVCGFWSGCLLATTPLGLDSIGWASAHVTNIAIGCICFGFYYWIIFVSKSGTKYLITSLILFAAGLLADPFRAFPILLFIYLSARTFHFKYSQSILSRFRVVIIGSVIALPLFVYLERQRITETSVFKFFSSPGVDVSLILHKFYVIGNYFNSVYNLMFGWIFPGYEYLSTGEYNRLLARIGFSAILFFTGFLIVLAKRKSSYFSGILFFLVWILVFYIPSWMSEPRLTMGATHRYMVFSSIGVVGLTVFLLSLIKRKLVAWAMVSIIIGINIVTAQRFLRSWSDFRSRSLVSRIWQQIDADVSPDTHQKVFIVTGSHPITQASLNLSGVIPFLINRKINSLANRPIYSDSIGIIEDNICQNTVLLSDIYVWSVNQNGQIHNISDGKRREWKERIQSCPVSAEVKK
jgi:hypothetical protein